MKHHPALDYELLPQFMAELRANPNLSARALELLILTAARTDEIRCSTWSELDLNRQMWVIPKERMKAKNEHRVALSGDAVALIERLQKLDNYLFSGSKKSKPISNGAMSQLLKRMGYTDITVHGFRSTFRDWVAEQTNFSGRLAETAMAHKLQSETIAHACIRNALCGGPRAWYGPTTLAKQTICWSGLAAPARLVDGAPSVTYWCAMG